MASKSQEDIIREYLTSLKEPKALIDHNRIAELSEKLEQSDDAIERLKLRQEIERASEPPREELEQNFVEVAKQWAERNGISAEALRSEGVPSQVLRKAGFSVKGDRRRKSTTRKAASRSRVRTEDVREAIVAGQLGQEFTKRQVQDHTGASPASATNAINALVDEGRVEEAGTASQPGPGRAPTLYRLK